MKITYDQSCQELKNQDIFYLKEILHLKCKDSHYNQFLKELKLKF